MPPTTRGTVPVQDKRKARIQSLLADLASPSPVVRKKR